MDLDKWYENLLNKSINDYSINDIAICLRQKIMISEMFVLALLKFNNDNEVGEQYDGEIFWQLIKIDVNSWKGHLVDLKGVYSYSKKQLTCSGQVEKNEIIDWQKRINDEYNLSL